MSDDEARERELEQFDRDASLWCVVMDRPEVRKASELEEAEVGELRELATDCGVEVKADWTREKVLDELKALYLPWNKRLTRDAARALTIPQEARQVLEQFIRECPVRFLRWNAKGLLSSDEGRGSA